MTPIASPQNSRPRGFATGVAGTIASGLATPSTAGTSTAGTEAGTSEAPSLPGSNGISHRVGAAQAEAAEIALRHGFGDESPAARALHAGRARDFDRGTVAGGHVDG